MADRKDLKDLIFKLTRPFLVLTLTGVVIGILHSDDFYLAWLLFLLGAFIVRDMWPQRSPAGRLILAGGMLCTGALGIYAESWGIRNGYWVYHDLLGGRTFPMWLPAAWMLAFLFLYRVEERLIRHFNLRGAGQRLWVAALASLLLPTWGEIVSINLGVWSYSWGWKVLGIPSKAIILLVILHMSTYLILSGLCRLFSLEDAVFAPNWQGSEPELTLAGRG